MGDCLVSVFYAFETRNMFRQFFHSDTFSEVDIRRRSGLGIAQLGGFGTAGLPHLVFYCYHQSAQGGGEQENIKLNMET